MTSTTAIIPPQATERNVPGEMRRGLQSFRNKSTAVGLTLFALDATAYTALFLALVLLRLPWMVEVGLSIFLGLVVTRLFIVGHDAAHGSLTGRPILDGLIARLAFLPALHPCSLWQVGHNRVHHSFTNLKGIDFIWIPFSPAEYNRLPAWRQITERFYRSVFGLGAYYMFEVWWNYLSFKGISALGKSRNIYVFDVALSLAFLILQLMAVFVLTPASAGSHQAASLGWTIAVSVVIPFLVWNWLMGFIIYNHHTHASVRFYNNRSQWRFYEGQVKGTVHLVFPRPFGILLNQIMEHTAHHVDVKIPFYRLGAAQRFFEARMKDDLIVQKWSLRSFFSTLRCCQLYDYDRHCWVTFDNASSRKGNIQ
jgi:omega-6 fatty acid desaturase (delta-12 desaturase)